MHQWLRRFHVIATVGGGFTGAALGLATLVGNWSQLNALAILLVFGLFSLCAWAITVGLRLSEGTDVHRELRLFYILQVPNFTTPVLSFHAGFGLMLYVGALPNGRNIQAQLGADWNGSILHDSGWFLAINIIPMIMLWLLQRSNKSLARTREG
jgi:hypothetical protein